MFTAEASCVHPDLPYCVEIRSRHVSWRHEFEREPSTGKLAHPLHLMLVGEACSATTARGAGFVRPRCASRVTKIHSAAAPAQSPSAVLIGYDGTTLFHHATYAASYTTRSAAWQAMQLATPGAVPTRQRLDMLNGGFLERARKSRSMISFACNAIMYEQYVTVTASVGPTYRGPNGHVRTSLEI